MSTLPFDVLVKYNVLYVREKGNFGLLRKALLRRNVSADSWTYIGKR